MGSGDRAPHAIDRTRGAEEWKGSKKAGRKFVVLNDEIHYAHEVEKTNTTQLDTFKSPNRGRAALADAAKKGIAVVRASRTGSGLVVRNVEVDDDKLGFIAAMELNPQKARILLILGLMKTQDRAALQKFFMEY